MHELVAMWKNPKMLTYIALTALIYPVVLYPFLQYTFFGTHADYFRVGVAVPAAFSFLFGPAAAWGAAFGNIIYDVLTDGLNAASIFGFIGNFLIAYVPYKLWRALTSQKPDMRSVKKVLLFMGLAALSCCLCGLVIGWGLFYLFAEGCPFVMTALTIFATDAMWAVVLGPVILAISYGFFSKRKLLYSDLLNLPLKPQWSKTRSLAMLVFGISTVLCIAIPLLYSFNVWLLLPFMLLSVGAVLLACR